LFLRASAQKQQGKLDPLVLLDFKGALLNFKVATRIVVLESPISNRRNMFPRRLRLQSVRL
jgi:hypothetical protein